MIKPLRYSISKAAQRDLARIYLYIAEESPQAGRRLVQSLENKIKSLAHSGNTGVARDWMRAGLRAFPHKDRCIYFTVDDHRLKIIRILHVRQNTGPELFAPDNEE